MHHMNMRQSALDSMHARALAQMRANIRQGYDPRYRCEYSYVMPSPGRYEWQWLWDSCFHVIALARLDTGMATRELETLMIPQRDDGFLGHLTYWGRRGALLSPIFGQSRPHEWRRRNTGMIQPPVLAQALLTLWKATHDDQLLIKMLPKVRAFYQWISNERDPESEGLIGVISPYECGLDNSPAYDIALELQQPTRKALLWKNWLLDWHNAYCGKGHDYKTLLKRNRMIMIDPFMNAVYADGWDAISTMHQHLGETELAESATQMCRKTINALNEQCWDETQQRWMFLRGRERKRETTFTVASIFPIIIPGMDTDKIEQVVKNHLMSEERFWTPYPIPSVAASEDSFAAEDENTIWRGPVCMNINWLIARGLRRAGFIEPAQHIEAKSIEMANKDFREFYSPISGRGMRGTNFGWATVAVDMSSISVENSKEPQRCDITL